MNENLTITSDSSRLKEAIDKLGMSIKAFAEQIEVDPSTLAKKIKGEKRLTPKDYKAIEAKSTVNVMWLRTGTEPMFAKNIPPITRIYKSSDDNDTGIPFYNNSFECGIAEFTDDSVPHPAEYISIPCFKDATMCCLASGESMVPVIHNNDILVLRGIRLGIEYLDYGEIYAVDTVHDMRTVKRVRKGSDRDHLLLEPINKEYDSSEIKKSDIRNLFRVIGIIRKI